MTQVPEADYTPETAGKCPACKSKSLEGGSFDVDGSTAYQRMSCNDCPASWLDAYELNRYLTLRLEDS